MNPSLSSFLVEAACRAIRVEYDPDWKNNNTTICRLYKTLDPNVKVDDLVVVPTGTRHGFTVVKVVEVDFTINYTGNDEYRWIVGPVDKAAYDALLEADKAVMGKVGKIQENKMKRELMEAMGLTTVDTASLSYSGVPVAATTAPQRAPEPGPAPSPPRRSAQPAPSYDDDIPF